MKYLQKLCNKLYRFYKNRLDYHNSKNEKIDNIDTIIFGFGPLRNFTTLIASIFSLHPQVQVLNHGGRRVFRQKKLNFMIPEFSQDKFIRFLKFAAYASYRGKRGPFGGSIYYSHAFDNADVKNAYINRYGEQLQKNNYRVLFWKENQLIYNYITREEKSIYKLINNKIKFMTPIRNPLDIAKSYKENQFTHLLYNRRKKMEKPLYEIIDKILLQFITYCRLKEKYPSSFFHFLRKILIKIYSTKFAIFSN